MLTSTAPLGPCTHTFIHQSPYKHSHIGHHRHRPRLGHRQVPVNQGMYTPSSSSSSSPAGMRRVQALSAAGSSSGDSKTAAARILGSGTAGIFELVRLMHIIHALFLVALLALWKTYDSPFPSLPRPSLQSIQALFHPFDTAAKRLMSWEGRIIVSGQTMTNLNNAVFRKQASAAPLAKWMSLFPGVSFGAAYKVLQRAYKFGGQPFVRDYLTTYHKAFFDDSFGKRNGKTMIYATAGSIMGVGEIVLLPLDVLKIKAQTNPEAFKGRGLIKIISDEGMSLYRGASWTAARNAPGSFALFGGSAAMKDYVFKLEKYSDATFFQDSMASVAGAVASITVAQPLVSKGREGGRKCCIT